MIYLSRVTRVTFSSLCLMLLFVSPAQASPETWEPWDTTQQASLSIEIDIEDLTERLVGTPAIGFFAKLDLKHRFGLLLEDIGRYNKGSAERVLDIDTLRQRFNDILIQTLRMIEDQDPTLHKELSSAQDALWIALQTGSLMD